MVQWRNGAAHETRTFPGKKRTFAADSVGGRTAGTAAAGGAGFARGPFPGGGSGAGGAHGFARAHHGRNCGGRGGGAFRGRVGIENRGLGGTDPGAFAGDGDQRDRSDSAYEFGPRAAGGRSGGRIPENSDTVFQSRV